jgi:YjbE family integral membrane protein
VQRSAGDGLTRGRRPQTQTGSELGLIASNLDPALWGASLSSIFSGFGGPGFWIGVPQIALVNAVLSGDTAVVIALACRGLPPARRPWGILVGAGTAALLLFTFALIVAPLLAYPYVKLIGGLALIYIAIKLLVQRSAREEVAAATNLSAVVKIVVTADIILGLDNVIALAGIARGNVALLVVGLAISLPIILAGAALFMKLLDRFPLLIWAGAILLGWVGGDIVAGDAAVSRALTAAFGEDRKQLAQMAAAGAGAVLVVVAGAVARRLRKSTTHAGPPGGETA